MPRSNKTVKNFIPEYFATEYPKGFFWQSEKYGRSDAPIVSHLKLSPHCLCCCWHFCGGIYRPCCCVPLKLFALQPLGACSRRRGVPRTSLASHRRSRSTPLALTRVVCGAATSYTLSRKKGPLKQTNLTSNKHLHIPWDHEIFALKVQKMEHWIR